MAASGTDLVGGCSGNFSGRTKKKKDTSPKVFGFRVKLRSRDLKNME